ncbi:MAG: hypothetical protein P8M80_12970 [Pirellulaceae bacterium]|nr:hypothetical protein [Pirellulaceae bacterium]
MIRPQMTIQYLVLLSLGIAIAFFFNMEIAGALLPSIRAGWRSWANFCWVLRVDPNRRRAWVVSGFCLADGFFKAAAAAAVTIGIFVAIFRLTGRLPNQNNFAVTMTILATAVFMTSLIGLTASFVAMCGKIKVWVHPELPRLISSQLRSIDPQEAARKFNHAIFVMVTSICVPILIGFGLLLIEERSVGFSLALLLMTFFAGMFGYLFFFRRIIAEEIETCWSGPSE